MSTRQLDVRPADGRVTFSVRATDPTSGVRSVFLRIKAPNDDPRSIELRRVSGTRHDGIWRATVPFPQCGTVDGIWSTSVKAYDRADRHVVTIGPGLTVTALPPAVSDINKRTDQSGSTVLQFDAPVVGLSDRTAVVTTQGGTSAIPGSWACTAGNGLPVDCLEGPLTTAAFTPSTPTSALLTVELNPEHVLGLLDLGGFPAGREYRI